MASPLDAAVLRTREELEDRGVRSPSALFLLGTGTSDLLDRLHDRGSTPLADAAGVPRPWRVAELHHGLLGDGEDGLPVWLLDDLSADAPLEEFEHAWQAAFPVWLAAAAGATMLIHTSAGIAVGSVEASRDELAAGSLAILSDHINLSGTTPLLGLGETRLGPLFPDVSDLHDERMRALGERAAASAGLQAVETVAACCQGPANQTPAERAWYANCGAGVAVQGLAAPLIAAAHAGLRALALVALTEDCAGAADLATAVKHSREMAGPLCNLLATLGPSLRQATEPEESRG